MRRISRYSKVMSIEMSMEPESSQALPPLYYLALSPFDKAGLWEKGGQRCQEPFSYEIPCATVRQHLTWADAAHL